jgi:hypothetical protein
MRLQADTGRARETIIKALQGAPTRSQGVRRHVLDALAAAGVDLATIPSGGAKLAVVREGGK